MVIKLKGKTVKYRTEEHPPTATIKGEQQRQNSKKTHSAFVVSCPKFRFVPKKILEKEKNIINRSEKQKTKKKEKKKKSLDSLKTLKGEGYIFQNRIFLFHYITVRY